MNSSSKAPIPLTGAAVLLMSVFAVLLLFFGSVDYRSGEDRFTVHTSLRTDLALSCSQPESIGLREGFEAGKRISGFAPEN